MALRLLYQCRDYDGKPQDFMTLVIEPVLDNLPSIPCTSGAAQLLLGTALHESGGLKWRHQNGGGPARGLFQMEKATHDDIWSNYLKFRTTVADEVKAMTRNGKQGDADELVYNDNYAAAMCRVHYYRSPSSVPSHGDIDGHAKLWKQAYNTVYGAGTVQKYKDDWKAHGGDKVSVSLTCTA